LNPILHHLLYKCSEEHRFQAAGNERKKERILIEIMKERKKEREKERKKEERKKERKIPANCRVDQLLVQNVSANAVPSCRIQMKILYA
jgi:hypothetical protein